MKALFAAVSLLISSVAYGQTVNQTSTGYCSPNINGAINIVWIDCHGVDPSSLKRIGGLLTDFASLFPETVNYLNQMIAKQQKEIDKRQQELHSDRAQIQSKQNRIETLEQLIREWIQKYNDIDARLKSTNDNNDELRKDAIEAFHNGDLDRADALLKELTDKEDKLVDQIAKDFETRGLIAELRFKPEEASGCYRTAYQYRPHDVDIAMTYSAFLEKQHRLAEAKNVNLKVLDDLNKLIETQPKLYLVGYFRINETLGIDADIHNDFNGAIKYYSAAITAAERLKKEFDIDPIEDKAHILNNMAIAYSHVGRLAEAQSMYITTLNGQRAIDKLHPNTQQSMIATTLLNLAMTDIALGDNVNMQAAHDALAECIAIVTSLNTMTPHQHDDLLVLALINMPVHPDGTDWKGTQEKGLKQAVALASYNYDRDPDAWIQVYIVAIGNTAGFLIDVEQKYKEGLDLLSKGESVLESYPHRDSPDFDHNLIARLLATRGGALEKLGNAEEAHRFCAEADDIYKREPGEKRLGIRCADLVLTIPSQTMPLSMFQTNRPQ